MKFRYLLLLATWLGLALNTKAADRDPVAELEAAGATIQRDLSVKSRPVLLVRYNLRQVTDTGNLALKELEELPAIEFLGSGDTELTPMTLNALRGKSSLKRMSIAYAKISDESAKILATLRSLETLELQSQIDMSRQAFHEILKLRNLKELMISDRLFNDEVIDDLKNLPFLKTLSIRSLFVSDDNLASLREMTNLSTLRIFVGERVTLDGLRTLASMRLKQLDLTYFHANITGLKEIRKAEKLERLRLVDARKVNDDTIPILSEMSDLKELEIVGAKFTKAGSKELKNSLPKCKITLVDF